MTDSNLLALPDGRTIAWLEHGAPQGRPVLALHGSPGSRLTRYPHAEHLAEANIRLITYDRPGYGLSTPKPGRTVADAAVDVAALLDHLELDRVAVTGQSGGGPHALALATLTPERCTVVAVSVGVAPADQPDLDFFEGMDPENIRRFQSAAGGRAACTKELTPDLEAIVRRAHDDPSTILGDMKIPEADRAVLRELGSSLAEAVIESARTGPWGFIDDYVAMVSPWGFDPRHASAPVLISYGAHDVNVPAGHGRWLAANVPNTGVTINHAGGHLASPKDSLAKLIQIAAAPRSPS